MRYVNVFIACVTFFFSVEVSHAETCQRPSPPPDVAGEHYKALQKDAAYAAFMTDECGFASDVQRKYGALVKTIFDDSAEAQQQGMDEFNDRKKQLSNEIGYLSLKKSCLWDTGKTRAIVNKASDDISSYMDDVAAIRKKQQEKINNWNDCLARERAAQQAALEDISKKAMELTRDHAKSLLLAGWPLGGMLKPQRVGVTKSAASGNGYGVVTRLWYLNALGSSESIDIEFSYDAGGNETCVEFGDYSDAIAKKYLPLRQLPRCGLLDAIK